MTTALMNSQAQDQATQHSNTAGRDTLAPSPSLAEEPVTADLW